MRQLNDAPGTLNVDLAISTVKGAKVTYVIDGKETDVPVEGENQKLTLEGLGLGPVDVEVRLYHDGKLTEAETFRTKDVLAMRNQQDYIDFLIEQGANMDEIRQREALFMNRVLDQAIADRAREIVELRAQKPRLFQSEEAISNVT